MRICTITCHRVDNYGARLQAYALARHLSELGHSVQIIDYRPSYLEPVIRIWYWPGYSLKEWVKLFLRYPERVRAKKRHEAFCRFSEKYLPVTPKVYHTIDELRSTPPRAEKYIAGSDQIWNPTFKNGTDPAFYLDFGPTSVMRESFAASFAIEEIPPDFVSFVKTNLRRFDKITVREHSAVKMLARLGVSSTQQDDPVLLLSAARWEEIEDHTGEGERYVLVYDFFSDPALRKRAQEIAREKQLPIYAVCPRKQHYARKNFTTSGPETFVSLIRHAAILVTNSYHGILFAHLFNRPFCFVERPDGMNERMKDYLSRFPESAIK